MGKGVKVKTQAGAGGEIFKKSKDKTKKVEGVKRVEDSLSLST